VPYGGDQTLSPFATPPRRNSVDLPLVANSSAAMLATAHSQSSADSSPTAMTHPQPLPDPRRTSIVSSSNYSLQNGSLQGGSLQNHRPTSRYLPMPVPRGAPHAPHVRGHVEIVLPEPLGSEGHLSPSEASGSGRSRSLSRPASHASMRMSTADPWASATIARTSYIDSQDNDGLAVPRPRSINRGPTSWRKSTRNSQLPPMPDLAHAQLDTQHEH